MKTYDLTKRLSAKAKDEINRIIETHERYRNSYFYKPSTSASSRRAKEKSFVKSNPDVKFITQKGELEVKMTYQETCGNVYYSLSIYQGDNKKTISAIKNLLK